MICACFIRALPIGVLLFLTAFGQAEAIDLLKGLMPGAVSSVHEKEESDCLKCHTLGQDHFFDKCLECHKEVKADVAQKQGFHGAIDASMCETCHTEHVGREHSIVTFDQHTFDHRQSDFPLLGRHRETPCGTCHLNPKHRDTPHACIACHERKDKHKGTLGRECGRCHNPKDWPDISFNHSTTKFPLEAKHQQVACEKCHTAQPFDAAPTACVGCHKKDDYHKGVLGQQCESCHTARSWKEPIFDHKKTAFALVGRHQRVDCLKCHTTPKLKETPKVCATCHKRDDRHKGKLGQRCNRCHTAENWKRIGFDHSKTDYPLIGKHRPVPCTKCHVKEQYKLPSDCHTCHRKDDPHKGKLGKECTRCHTERGWKIVETFDHQKTDFPLLGKHKPVQCAKCHTTALFTDTSSTCRDCHVKDDTHKGSFGKKCASCHTADGWKKLIFNHDKDTPFELTGKHVKVACEKCHTKPLFEKKTPSQCIGCHAKDDYHKGTFGKACGECHTTEEWKLEEFDHAKETGYALAGKHRDVKCQACHVRPLFAEKTSRRCVSCHRRDDPHAGELGPRCELCHTEQDFHVIKNTSRWFPAGLGRLTINRR